MKEMNNSNVSSIMDDDKRSDLFVHGVDMIWQNAQYFMVTDIYFLLTVFRPSLSGT